MDLRKFRKVRDAGETAHFKHPSGHEIRISKKGLDEHMRKALADLPLHMEEGGEVPQSDESAQYRQAFANDMRPIIDSIVPDGTMSGIAETFGSLLPKSQAPAAPQVTEQSYVQPTPQGGFQAPTGNVVPANEMPMQMAPQVPQQEAPDPYGANAYTQAAQAGLGLQMEGIQGMANAESQSGWAQAKAAQENVRVLEKQQLEYQKNYADIDRELQGVVTDMQRGHINPSAFWESRSSWQKASIMIGLALGGNPDIIKNAIERDVNAQKMNLDRQNTIFAAQMKRLGNVKDATDMTRLIQASIYASKLSAAAASAQSPIAKARAQQAMGALWSQYAPLASQLAMRRSMGQMTKGQGGQADPATMVRMIVPENMQKDAYKELAEAQSLVKGRDSMIGAFDKAAKENTIGNKILSPIQSSRRFNALMQPLIAKLSKDTAGRFTEQDAEMLMTLAPGAMDDKATRQTKRNKMIQLLEEKMNFPILKSYGITPASASRYGEGGEKRIQLGAPVR